MLRSIALGLAASAAVLAVPGVASAACPSAVDLLPAELAGELTPRQQPKLAQTPESMVAGQQDAERRRSARMLRRNGFRSGAVAVYVPRSGPRRAAAWVEVMGSGGQAADEIGYEIRLGKRNVRAERGPVRAYRSQRVPGARGFLGVTKAGTVEAANLWLAVGDRILFVGVLDPEGRPRAWAERILGRMADRVRAAC